jgi:archaellin
MVEIGPNLLAAVLALVSLGTAIVAAIRAERALTHTAEQATRIADNTSRISAMEFNGQK